MAGSRPDRTAPGQPPRAGSPFPRPAAGAARTYVLVALGWTWLGVGGAAAIGGRAGHPLHLVGLLGPLVAWGLVLRSHHPAGARRAFLRRVVDVRTVPRAWWPAVLAVGAAPALLAAGAGVAGVGGDPVPGPGVTTGLVAGAAAFALAAGLVEEPGWRGVAHADAAAVLGGARSALLLGVLWSLWHLPLHLLEGTHQHDLGLWTEEFWSSMAIRVPLAVLLVWLVVGTRGAVVAAVAAHALGNALGELLPGGTAPMRVELAVLTAAAVVVLARRGCGPAGAGPG